MKSKKAFILLKFGLRNCNSFVLVYTYLFCQFLKRSENSQRDPPRL